MRPHLKNYEYQYFKYGDWVTITYATYTQHKNLGTRIRKRLRTSMKCEETPGNEIVKPEGVKVNYYRKRKGEWVACCVSTYNNRRRVGKEVRREVEYDRY